MATSEVVVLLLAVVFFFSYLPCTATSVEFCSSLNSRCGIGAPAVRFPFQPSYVPMNLRCGYPRFVLSCNNQNQTILNLHAHAGEFIVQRINYTAQSIWINDPEKCLPKRFLHQFNLSRSPFDQIYREYTFFNCSPDTNIPGFMPIPCLSGIEYSVMAARPGFLDDFPFLPCRKISTVSVPMQWPASDPSSDVPLTWSVPSCRSCLKRGGVCGFKSDSSFDIGCSNLPSHAPSKTVEEKGQGLPRTAKYGIIIGVGIPGLICIIGLACYVCGRIRTYGRHHHPSTEFSTSIVPQPAVLMMGLDGPTIESYPKTVLGESRRLPKPNDGTCPICLSDYQPKDTLRTIPDCNHYFHANCIDEWLKMNATCPLCRNSPDGSLFTPCSSSTSLSLSSSSSTPSSS